MHVQFVAAVALLTSKHNVTPFTTWQRKRNNNNNKTTTKTKNEEERRRRRRRKNKNNNNNNNNNKRKISGKFKFKISSNPMVDDPLVQIQVSVGVCFSFHSLVTSP